MDFRFRTTTVAGVAPLAASLFSLFFLSSPGLTSHQGRRPHMYTRLYECLKTYRACLRRCRRQRDSLDLHLAILIREERAGDIINLHVSHLNSFTAPGFTHTLTRRTSLYHTEEHFTHSLSLSLSHSRATTGRLVRSSSSSFSHASAPATSPRPLPNDTLTDYDQSSTTRAYFLPS